MSDGTPGEPERKDAAEGPAPPGAPSPTAARASEPADAPAEAYQAAGRVSPWGYVFLGGLLMLVMGVAWMKVEQPEGPIILGWFAIALALTLVPFAWHAVDWFPAIAGRRGAAGGMVFLTLALGVLVFGFVSALNVLRKEKLPAVDLTESGRFTLGEESRKILESLGEGTVYAVYLEHNGPRVDLALRGEAQEQLRVYGRASGRVQVQVFDAFRDRDAADRALRAAGVTATTAGEDVDVIVFSYAEAGKEVASGKQKEVRVESFTFAKASSGFDSQPKWLGERVLTSAIRELVFERYKVYVTGGHGEKSLAEDLRAVRERLSSQNLEVVDRPLDLVAQPKVPDDCDLLLVAGPASPFAPEEARAIEAWLSGGRSLVVLFDADRNGRRETGLESVLGGFSLESRINYVVFSPLAKSVDVGGVQQGAVIEMSPMLYPGTAEYADHPAVRAIREGSGFRTIFVESSFLEVHEDPKPGVEVDAVVFAPELPGELKDVPRPFAARIEPGRRDFRSPDPSRDKTGARLPLVVAASRSPQGEGTAKARDSRIVVCGDTDAFTDSVTREYAPNLDLFGGLVQWSLRREELVAVSDRTLEMELADLDERKQRMAFWLPFASTTTALLAGAAVWWARRR